MEEVKEKYTNLMDYCIRNKEYESAEEYFNSRFEYTIGFTNYDLAEIYRKYNLMEEAIECYYNNYINEGKKEGVREILVDYCLKNDIYNERVQDLYIEYIEYMNKKNKNSNLKNDVINKLSEIYKNEE